MNFHHRNERRRRTFDDVHLASSNLLFHLVLPDPSAQLVRVHPGLDCHAGHRYPWPQASFNQPPLATLVKAALAVGADVDRPQRQEIQIDLAHDLCPLKMVDTILRRLRF
ncbi:hypothetical protein D9M70_568580 [compost metagenome]